MKNYQSEPGASARDAADTGLSLVDASGYEGKFLSAARPIPISGFGSENLGILGKDGRWHDCVL